MTDKQYEGINKLLDKFCKTWLSTLGFNRWTVHCTLLREIKEGSPDCVASCDAQWEYNNMSMKFYGPRCLDLTEKQLEEVFVHECLHALVNEMREWTSDKMYHEEHVVTMLTQAICWAKYDGRKEGKKCQE